MSLYIQDIKRSIMTFSFWIGVVLVVLFSYSKYQHGFESAHFVYMINNYGFIGTLNRVIEAMCNDSIGIPAVIAAVISFGTVTCSEMKNGYIVNELTRINPKKFIIVRTLSTATIGILIILIVYLLWFIYAFIVDPNPSVQITTKFGSIGVVYQKSLWGYLLLYALQDILLVSIYSIFSMGVSLISRNKYIGYTVPLIYFLGREVFGTYLSDDFIFIYAMFPFDIVSSIFESFSATLFVLPISLILVFVGYKQWRHGKW